MSQSNHGLVRLAVAVAATLVTAGCAPQAQTPTAAAPAITLSRTSGKHQDTGISMSNFVAAMGIPAYENEKMFGIFYLQAGANRAELAAAPARLCKSQGLSLISSEDKPLAHPEQMPGTRKMIVHCTPS